MRTLVIASGKGGTGKTTIAALLVEIAARTRRLVVADCDIEASNLPLALRAGVISRTPVEGKPRTVIDDGTCERCGACVDRCRFGALSLADDDTPVIDPWLCESCGACAQACPVDAIGLEPQQAGEVVVGVGPAGPIAFGQLRPGEDLSGKVVTNVRERAGEIARARGADLVIVDGPPGVGCPTIASITGVQGVLAVAEPTLPGEHDLRRLVALTRQMRVPVKVVLNKADLSASGAGRVRSTCQDLDLEILGEVAFDPELPGALEAVAQEDLPPSSLDALASMHSAQAIWSGLELWIDGWAPPARTPAQ